MNPNIGHEYDRRHEAELDRQELDDMNPDQEYEPELPPCSTASSY